MKKTKSTEITYTSIALICMLALIFAALVFFAYDTQGFLDNSILLGITAVILLLLFLSRRLLVGLIGDALVILLYGGYTLYICLDMGAVPPPRLYFYVFWIPLITLAFWYHTRQTLILETQNINLRKIIDNNTTIDEVTGLKNLKAYNNDATIYMHIARRYNLGLSMVAWSMDPDKKENIEEIREQIKCSTALLRNEDEIYLVSEKPYVFLLLLLVANSSDGEVVLRRLKAKHEEAGLNSGENYAYISCDTSPDSSVIAQMNKLVRKLTKPRHSV